jgi:hypothetical protein
MKSNTLLKKCEDNYSLDCNMIVVIVISCTDYNCQPYLDMYKAYVDDNTVKWRFNFCRSDLEHLHHYSQMGDIITTSIISGNFTL